MWLVVRRAGGTLRPKRPVGTAAICDCTAGDYACACSAGRTASQWHHHTRLCVHPTATALAPVSSQRMAPLHQKSTLPVPAPNQHTGCSAWPQLHPVRVERRGCPGAQLQPTACDSASRSPQSQPRPRGQVSAYFLRCSGCVAVRGCCVPVPGRCRIGLWLLDIGEKSHEPQVAHLRSVCLCRDHNRISAAPPFRSTAAAKPATALRGTVLCVTSHTLQHSDVRGGAFRQWVCLPAAWRSSSTCTRHTADMSVCVVVTQLQATSGGVGRRHQGHC